MLKCVPIGLIYVSLCCWWPKCSQLGFSLTWKVGELIWSRKVRVFCRWSGKNDVYQPSCVAVVYFCWKNWNYTFSACYNKTMMKRSRCRAGGAEWILHRTSTCISDGSANNTEHSQVGEFHFWNWVRTLPVVSSWSKGPRHVCGWLSSWIIGRVISQFLSTQLLTNYETS